MNCLIYITYRTWKGGRVHEEMEPTVDVVRWRRLYHQECCQMLDPWDFHRPWCWGC